MAKKYSNEQPIALGNVYEQAYKQLPAPTPMGDTSLTGVTAQSILSAMNDSYQQSQTPNPTVQSQGGAMTQSSNGISAGNGGNVMTQPQNTSWSRQTLQGMGINDNDIGWNAQTGMVTLGGKDYLKPQYVSDDGKSYNSSQDTFKAAQRYYSDIGKPVEGVDAYVADALGVKNAVTWSDGNLMVGGQLVPTVYVDENGTAYAHKADIDKAISSYRDRTGLKGNQSVLDTFNSRYGNQINKALGKVMNREEWSYTPENDAAYRSYRDQYMREGDRAYQNAYADMAANTGGYGSSAAMNAAGQQWNYYMQQLGDRIPQLQQNDYNRYVNEYDMRRQELNSLRDVANDYYNREYQANRDIINDLNAANEASYKRRQDAKKDYVDQYNERLLQQQVAQGDIDTSRYGDIADLNVEQQRLSNESLRLANWQAQAQNILTKYQYQANPDMPISQVDAEAIGIAPNQDGTYPSINELQRTYGSIQALLEQIMFEQSTKPQMEFTYRLNNGLLGL